MPKGRSGHGGSSKKPTQLVANEENSNVVFGDPNTPSKTKKAQSSDGQDKNGLNPPVNNEDVTKRPDTRKLIGGASWTGKLPVNMLSEHCQKQRWAKPEYTMVATSDLMLHSTMMLIQHVDEDIRWLFINGDSEGYKSENKRNRRAPAFQVTLVSQPSRNPTYGGRSTPLRSYLRSFPGMQHAQYPHDAAADLSRSLEKRIP